MKRSPIRQEKGFTTLSYVSLEIRAARFTVVDAEIFLSFDRQNGEPVRIILYAKWTSDSPESPPRAATAAKQ